MMLFLENVRLALFSLKANKMRSLLTMLGIIIGIASVITIVTIGNSMTSSLMSEISSMGSNTVNVNITLRERDDEVMDDGLIFKAEDFDKRPYREEDFITEDMIRGYVEKYQDSIQAIGLSQHIDSVPVYYGKKATAAYLYAANAGEFVIENYEFLAGQFFSEQALEGKKAVCIINNKLAEKFFGENINDAIGKQIQVGIDDLTVVGVYKTADSPTANMGLSYDDPMTTLYVSLPYAQEEYQINESYYYFTVKTKPEVNSVQFANITKQYFTPFYRNNNMIAIEASSLDSVVSMVNSMMNTLTMAVSLIAGIALLVGGIGVMNIMLVSITERTREIGTRKALGAPNSSIRMQFIVEAVVICLIGGAIGVAIGVLGGGAIAKYAIKAEVAASVKSILVSLGFSMAIGVFFGYYPANKAAKMDPIEALRYE